MEGALITANEGNIIEGRAAPLGAYPHFRVATPFVFVSGASSRSADNSIVGADVADDGTVALDIRQQTRAVLTNLGEILGASGLGLSDVVDVTTFLVDMSDFAGYNDVYSEFFDSTGPARTTVAVAELPHPHLLIEIKAVALRPAER